MYTAHWHQNSSVRSNKRTYEVLHFYSSANIGSDARNCVNLFLSLTFSSSIRVLVIIDYSCFHLWTGSLYSTSCSSYNSCLVYWSDSCMYRNTRKVYQCVCICWSTALLSLKRKQEEAEYFSFTVKFVARQLIPFTMLKGAMIQRPN